MSAIAVGIAGTPANIDPHVAAIGPAQFLQALQERRDARLCLLIVRGQAHEYADAPHPLALLRPRHSPPRRRRTAEQRDDLAPSHHSITSSARASSAVGISRSSAFATMRLMTRLNLTGCSTGTSAGLVPRRILSTSSPARRHWAAK